MSRWDILRYTLYVVTAILVTYSCAKVTDKLITELSKKFNPKAIHWSFMRQVLKFLIIVTGLIFIVHNIPVLNQFSTSLVAGSAIIIAAVSLAAQGSMSNIIGGVFISLFKPFAVGDRVRLTSSNITGVVKDINFRHTVIATPQNSHIVIPNAVLNNEILENSNLYEDKICNFLDFRVQYDTDLDVVRSILENAVASHPFFMDQRTEEAKSNGAPVVAMLVRDLLENGIELRAGIWTEDIGKNFKMCSDIREALVKEFLKQGIRFACLRVQNEEIGRELCNGLLSSEEKTDLN